jgi:hypothetical protein
MYQKGSTKRDGPVTRQDLPSRLPNAGRTIEVTFHRRIYMSLTSSTPVREAITERGELRSNSRTISLTGWLTVLANALCTYTYADPRPKAHQSGALYSSKYLIEMSRACSPVYTRALEDVVGVDLLVSPALPHSYAQVINLSNDVAKPDAGEALSRSAPYRAMCTHHAPT